MARPRKQRTFATNSFVKMISSQVRQIVIDDIVKEFNEKNPNSSAKNRMAEAIQEGMYDRYTPTMYERRMDNKGLLSRSNMKIQYRFPKGRSEMYGPNQEFVFKIAMYNVAKPAPIQSASGWYTNAIGGQLLEFDSNIRRKNVQDMLYYWKDQGLVFNLFNDPKFHRWGSATHFNERIHRKFFNEGRLHRVFGSRLAGQLKGLKTKIK